MLNQFLEDHRLIKILTLIFSLILVAFSILYYKERVIMYDTSYYFFYLLQKQNFVIQHNRIGAVFTQILPLLAIALKMPLKLIAILYSVNAFLFYSVSAFIAGWFLKNWRVAILIAATPFVFATEENFWIVTEAQFIVPIWLLIYAFIDKHLDFNLLQYLLLGAIMFFGITIHPTSIFAFGFLWLFLFIQSKHTYRFLFVLIFIFVGLYLLKKLFLPSSYYEGNAFTRLNFVYYLFPNFFDISSNRLLMSHFFDRFLGISVLLFVGIALLSFFTKWWKAFLYFFSLCFIILFINVCFYDLYDRDLILFENYYQSIFFGLALLFTYDYKDRAVKILLLVIIVFLFTKGVIRSKDMSGKYTARIHWLRHNLKLCKEEKLIFDWGNAPQEQLIMRWCVPFETAILSSMEYGKTQTIFLYEGESEKKLALTESSYFLNIIGNIKISNVNNDFVYFSDSLNVYKEIEDCQK
jgi:hypothetical protein